MVNLKALMGKNQENKFNTNSPLQNDLFFKAVYPEEYKKLGNSGYSDEDFCVKKANKSSDDETKNSELQMIEDEF